MAKLEPHLHEVSDGRLVADVVRAVAYVGLDLLAALYVDVLGRVEHCINQLLIDRPAHASNDTLLVAKWHGQHNHWSDNCADLSTFLMDAIWYRIIYPAFIYTTYIIMPWGLMENVSNFE